MTSSSGDLNLGEELRRLRLAAGITGTELAHHIGANQSKISKIETGKQIPTEGDLDLIAKALSIPSDVAAELEHRARAEREGFKKWRSLTFDGFPSMQREFGELELSANHISGVAVTLLPGLLQTPSYARKVLALSGCPPHQLDHAVAVRMGRQQILTRPDKEFEFVISEFAFLARYASDAEMVEQIRQIRLVAGWENVTIRVLPIAAPLPVLLQHSYSVLGDRFVVVETISGRLDVTESDEIGRFESDMQTLKDAALDEADSRETLAAIEEGFRVRTTVAEPEAVPSRPGGAPAERRSSWESTPLNPRYTFEQFVIGSSNHIGHAAALAVAERPAQTFNPLFVYGAPGVGKTHLLHAIGNFMRDQAPELDVRYMTAENFAATFRGTLRDDSVQEFKEGLRRTDVLLIDDVQFLQNKVKTEEEFFHIFNALFESGRQLVISSDRTPRQLDQLADRLRERFEAGLVVEIEQPDERLRGAILRERVRNDNIPIDDDLALDRIAARVPANVRSLEGALIRVSAFASMRGEPVTSQLVDELLDSLHPHTARQVTEHHTPGVPIARIQSAVADHFELTLEELLGKDRSKRVAGPRQIAMFLACELSGETLPMIAAAFDRDPSTIIHACEKVESTHRTDPAAAAAVDSLRSVIHGTGVGVDGGN